MAHAILPPPFRRLLPQGLALLAWLGAAGCGGDEAPEPRGPLQVVSDRRVDAPLRQATEEELARFREGDALFDLAHRPADGLGPLYIRSACSSCHAEGAAGPGAVQKMEVLAADEKGASQEERFPYGPSVRPLMTSGAKTPVSAPVEDGTFRLSRRIGPPIFGRGYLEAIDDAEIERVEREQAARGEVSGRIHRVRYGAESNPDERFHRHLPGQEGLIGRFGFKARIATLDEFSADAFQGDMGLTTPLRPTELPNPDGLTEDAQPGVDVSIEGLNLVADYVRLLEIPSRPEPLDARGSALFEACGCSSCHVPSLRTRADHPIGALAGLDAPVFTDLLLHDMGEALADGPNEGDASAREWRTAPLVGLELLRFYLHDGRARTLDEAVRLHDSPGSEAAASVGRYLALTEEERQALLDFLATL